MKIWTKWLYWFLSTWHKLASENAFLTLACRQVWGAYSLLTVDMGKPSAPAQVVLCYRKQLGNSLESRAVSSTSPTPPGLCFRPCLKFLPWLPLTVTFKRKRALPFQCCPCSWCLSQQKKKKIQKLNLSNLQFSPFLQTGSILTMSFFRESGDH